MDILISTPVSCVAILLLFPALVLVIEAIASLLPDRKGSRHSSSGAKVALIIPAHNEAPTIGETIRSLTPQLEGGDALLVIADNCTDDTAAKARQAGATVLERINPAERGKGFALAYGVSYLSSAPPEVLVFVDADCRLSENGVARLAQQAVQWERPIQARNEVAPVDRTDPKATISSLAFCFKNVVRSRGLNRLGLPCHLSGTGMAIPWNIAKRLEFGSSNLIEDVQLGLDCAAMGHGPMLCSSVSVVSEMPPNSAAASVQRTRWEHGHLHFVLNSLNRHLMRAIRERNFRLLALCVDTAIPPLTFLVCLQALSVVLAAICWALTGTITALVAACAALLLTLSAFGIGWCSEGRRIAPAVALLRIPGYMLWKLPIYLNFFREREKSWIRTER